MRVIARVRERLTADLPLKVIFEASTLESWADSIEARRRAGHARPPLVPQPRSELIPVSFGQERLWLLNQSGQMGASYNIQLALGLAGDLDVAALESSLSELIRRHEVLRTRFGVRGGVPHQLIDPPEPSKFSLRSVDLSETAIAERESELLRHMEHETVGLFDFANGPLIRACLVKRGAREHALLLTIHHIIVDGWSIGVLVGELSALYGAYAEGQSSPLPELPFQYADYTIWQREWLQGAVLESQLLYWRERLRGAPPYLQLPTDRPRPTTPSLKGDWVSFELSDDLSKALTDLALSERVTLFMVFLAAFNVLLSHYSGQQDIVVGSGIAGRMDSNAEKLIGFFVNTLALRTDLSGDPTFRELLGRVKDVTLGAYAHQDLPFERLVIDLRPDRHLSRQSIFQVGMSLQNYLHEPPQPAGLSWSFLNTKHVTSQFDLVLHLSNTQDKLQGGFEYATDLFDRETIERMAEHFQVLLEGIVSDPDGLVS
jgi:hypothetical protein